MACGACSGVSGPEVLRSENMYVTEGGYTLMSFPGTDWYKGVHEGKVIYVVARQTDYEKLYPRTQLAEASDYARSIHGKVSTPSGPTLENIPCVQLEREAVTSVYG